MTLRFDICEGDTTTAGGKVYASSRDSLLDGRAVAYEGDPVWCPRCNTTGRILCTARRLTNKGVNGREQALSKDWCLCKCEPKPLLIASQQQSGTHA